MPGIICLEGNWYEKDLRKENSIAPVLSHLSINYKIDIIHKHCSTKEQLRYYLQLLSARKYKKYNIIYLAFHGRSGNIYLDVKNFLSLTELIELADDGVFRNRMVHFGSCTTLKNPNVSNLFLKETGAKLITGFTKKIDFHESSAFDMLYLGKLAYSIRYNAMIQGFVHTHESFVNHLGFISYPNHK